MTAADLPINAPRFDLKPGTLVRIGPQDGSYGLLKVERRLARFGSEPSRIEFLDVRTGQPVFKDDRTLAYHMRSGEFSVAADADGKPLPDVPRPGELSDRQDADANRRKAYVAACLALGSSLRKSRAVLVPVIAAEAAKRGEPPPGFTSVLGWIDRYERLGDTYGKASLATKPNRGNRRPRKVKGVVGKAIRYAIHNSRGKRTAADVRKLALARLAELDPDADASEVPSLRTFQRQISGQNRYVYDALRSGVGPAERKHRGRYERPRPKLPLEEVECDHTPLDILLCDEDRNVIFGKADMISFRDRCTGCCLGLAIGFDAPSYASFLAGLRHAIYPKDLSGYLGIENPWFAYGKFKRLYVDNALHFLGHDIRHALSELNIDLVEFIPGSPWLKGGEEKLQGDINRSVSHKLPGSTFSNPEERKRFEEYAELPILTVSELRAYLTWWICDEFYVREHEGLGFLSTLKDVPKRLWDEGVEKVPLPILPPEEIFIALTGSVDWRSINTKGIRWDHIRYQSNELDALRTNADHKNGAEEDGRPGRKHEGTQYKVTRDPYDLGAVWVHNHHDPARPLIRATAGRQDYAAGLTLHQHRIFIANSRKKVLASLEDPVDELAWAKRDVNELTRALLNRRRQTGVQKLLARFFERGERHHHRSIVSVKPESRALSAAPLDPRAPAKLLPATTVNRNSPNPTLAYPPSRKAEPEQMATGEGIPTRVDRGGKPARRRKASSGIPATPDASSVREQKRLSGWADADPSDAEDEMVRQEKAHSSAVSTPNPTSSTEAVLPRDESSETDDGAPARADALEEDRIDEDAGASDELKAMRERKRRDADWNS